MDDYTNDNLLLMARLSPCIFDAMKFLVDNDISGREKDVIIDAAILEYLDACYLRAYLKVQSKLKGER